MPLSTKIHVLHFKQRIMAVHCLGFEGSDGEQNLNSNSDQFPPPPPFLSLFNHLSFIYVCNEF